MRAKDLLQLFGLGAIWGGSYLFIRIAGPVLGSVWLIFGRVLIASLGLLAIALASRQSLQPRAALWKFLVLGLINAAVPFMLITSGVTRLNAGIAAIVNAMTPISTALVAAVWLRDPLTPRKMTGLALGVAGVATLVGWNPLPLSASVLLGVGQCLLATVFYACGSVFSRAAFPDDKPIVLAFGQQAGATLIQAALAVATPTPAPTQAALIALLALALLCTSVAYLISFNLIKTIGPVQTQLVTFLVPMFSVLWGVIFLGETINAGMLLGLALILSAVVLVARRTALVLPGKAR
jgi:drug/metabolite transporter (DMT)-like permease